MSFDAKFREICQREGQPHPPSAVANYVATRKAGRTLHVSGQAPFVGSDIPPRYIGQLGKAITTEVGAEASRIVGLNLLYNVQDALGTLDNVHSILAVDGMVNCVPAYTNHPKVIDGCSDLMVEVFGDRGKHTRSAVGQVSLAFEICVEIKLMVRISK